MRLGLLTLAAGLMVATALVTAQDPQVYRAGNDVSSPRLLKEVKPSYTPAAMRAKIQGAVLVTAVVREDGTVGDTKVIKSLDTKYGLDAEAVKVAKQWRFKPGVKDGKPVPVLVTIEIAFTLPRQ